MKRLLCRVWEVIYGLYAVISFCFLFLVCLALVLLPIRVPARRRVASVMSRLSLTVIGTRLTVQGLDNLPPGPCVVVANHASYLDGIVLQAVMPPRFTFVMKKETRRIPVGGLLLYRIHSEFVDRFNRRAAADDIRRLTQAAEVGRPLVFFPEGTFTREPGVGKFHNGAFAIAARLDQPVVPLAIHGTRAMLPSEQLLPRHGHILIQILPVVELEAAARRVEYLRDTARSRIIEVLGEDDLLSRRGRKAAAERQASLAAAASASRAEPSLDG